MKWLWRALCGLLSLLVPARDREFVLGDLDELDGRRVEDHGRLLARLTYCRDLVASGVARRWASESTRTRTGVRTLAWDLREAVRSLRAQPTLVALATVTMGIGIGSAGAVYGIIDQLVLQPVAGVAVDANAAFLTFENQDRSEVSLPWANAERLRGSIGGLEGLGAFRSLHATVTSGAEPRQVYGAFVVGDYFGVMGIRPAAGRLPTAEEVGVRADPDVVVISEHLWASQFDRSADVVGRRIEVSGRQVTVLGVAGGGFRGNDPFWPLDIWVPYSALSTFEGRPLEEVAAGRGQVQFFLARPATGVTLAALEAALDAAVETHPAGMQASLTPGVQDPFSREYAERPVPLLVALGLLVLLIPCANVANLLITRGVNGRGDTAVRRAMGASRGRLARKLMVESVLLASLGAAAGLAVATLLGRTYAGHSLWQLPAFEGMPIDRSALAFASLAALATAVVFGTLPAAAAGRFDVVSQLRNAARQTTPASGRTHVVLSVAQFALCLPLLVAGLTLVLHLLRVVDHDLGMDVEGLYIAEVDAGMTTVDDTDGSAMATLYRDVLAAVGNVPGVRDAALISPLPFVRMSPRIRLEVPGGALDSAWVEGRWVSPEWFGASGMELVAGRTFQDPTWTRGGPLELVVTGPLAERIFGTRDVVGRRVDVGFRTQVEARIVGVVGDVRVGDPRRGPEELAFVSEPVLGSEYAFGVIMRTAGPGAFPFDEVGSALRGAAPDLPVASPLPLSRRLAQSLAVERVFARLVTVLGALAMVVCGVGLYGVIALGWIRRKRELAVRIALGARPGHVAGHVAGPAVSVVVVGSAIGSVGVLWVSELLRGQAFAVNGVAGSAYVASALVLAAVALLASWAPTARALRTDPRPILHGE